MSRADRVGSFIQKEISEIICREIHDPQIVGPEAGLVSVTRVEMSPDLRLAKVFFSFLSPDDNKAAAALKHLGQARGFIRNKLGRHLTLRYLPDLVFIRDNSIAEGVRILKLLKDLSKENKTDAQDLQKGSGKMRAKPAARASARGSRKLVKKKSRG